MQQSIERLQKRFIVPCVAWLMQSKTVQICVFCWQWLMRFKFIRFITPPVLGFLPYVAAVGSLVSVFGYEPETATRVVSFVTWVIYYPIYRRFVFEQKKGSGFQLIVYLGVQLVFVVVRAEYVEYLDNQINLKNVVLLTPALIAFGCVQTMFLFVFFDKVLFRK